MLIMTRRVLIIILFGIFITVFSIGTVFGMHLDDTVTDMTCKKWVEIVEIAKQDYHYLIEDALKIAEINCGFDVDDLTS